MLLGSVLFIFSATGAPHPLPQTLPSPQGSSVHFGLPLVGLRRTLGLNQGHQGPCGLVQGLMERHCFPCGTQEGFSVVHYFFLI